MMTEQASGQGSRKQHRSFASEVEYEAAIDEVILRAKKTLHIFDGDLKRGAYSSLKRFEHLRDFLMRGRENQLVIVLHETDFLTARCPRLMGLLRSYGHHVVIHKTHEHARIASDPFVVADQAHYVHRFHQDNARGLLATDDYAGARELEERFGQLLDASHPAVSATTLGL
jgi:hypothetical protein